MKTKLRIDGDYIRQDGAYYCLTDLFKLTIDAGSDPWQWAIDSNCTREISRRGFLFKACWGRGTTLIEYAHYLTPGLYQEVIKALGVYEVGDLVRAIGKYRATMLDPRVRRHYESGHSVSMHSEPVTSAMVFSPLSDDWQPSPSYSSPSHSSHDSCSYDSGSYDSGGSCD